MQKAGYVPKYFLCEIFVMISGGIERPTTLLKKRLWHRCFPVNVAKFLIFNFLIFLYGTLPVASSVFYYIRETYTIVLQNLKGYIQRTSGEMIKEVLFLNSQNNGTTEDRCLPFYGR